MIISTVLQQTVILPLQFLFKSSSETRATITNQLWMHFFSSCIILRDITAVMLHICSDLKAQHIQKQIGNTFQDNTV